MPGFLPPSYQLTLTAGRQSLAGWSHVGGQPLRARVGADRRPLGLASGREPQVQRPVSQVHHVAAHVADLAAAEVPEAVPGQAAALR